MSEKRVSTKARRVGLRWQLVGFLAIAGGVALISVPAGIVVFGVLAFVYGTMSTWIGREFAKVERGERPGRVVDKAITDALTELRERQSKASS